MTAPIFEFLSKVYINHTDAGGIVYHANYLVFYENCRREFLEQLGVDGYFLTGDKGEKVFLVVGGIDIKYIKPLLLDSQIKVTIDEITQKTAGYIFKQSIFGKSKTGDWQLVNTATFNLPCVGESENGIKAIRVPSVLSNAFAQYQKQDKS